VPHAALPQWMGAQPLAELPQGGWVLVGLPYDGTTSYRPGTRFGPAALRDASWGLETYAPLWDASLGEAIYYSDAGELELPPGNRSVCLARIGEAAEAVMAAGHRWLGLGGEHLVTLPAFEACLRRHPDLAILHFDAHADLREDFMGEALSHATVLRRCVEQISPERYVQVGIRSGTPEEWAWMREHNTLLPSHEAAFKASLAEARRRLANRPVYLTIDLDVLDPSILPGTGTPEPGGLTYDQLQRWLLGLRGLNLASADVVELSPAYDPSGVSSVVAAKVVRDVLLLAATCPNASHNAHQHEALLATP
jgi:agmatinase